MVVNKHILWLFVLPIVIFSCDYKPRNHGHAIYKKHCQNCHLEEGQGLGALIPPIAGADYVLQNKEALACLITKGMSGKITVNGVEYEGEMPGNTRLTEVELTNVIHYILVDLNKVEKPFVINDIKEQLKACKD